MVDLRASGISEEGSSQSRDALIGIALKDSALRCFDMTMTHMAKSLVLCKDAVYQMDSQKISLVGGDSDANKVVSEASCYQHKVSACNALPTPFRRAPSQLATALASFAPSNEDLPSQDVLGPSVSEASRKVCAKA